MEKTNGINCELVLVGQASELTLGFYPGWTECINGGPTRPGRPIGD
ncbi:MAG TPA: hypothetical protein VGP47_01525 [Parachlamydiaceae bacterium]|nr:hypothetical protein [Parachlamydiaceae bacterium]